MVSTRSILILVLLFQAVSAVLFVVNIISTVTGLFAFSWMIHELIELGAAVGLLLGVILGAILLVRTVRRNRLIEDQLRVASGAFMDLLEDRFADWGLAPAERDVALFAIKGLSTPDIARLRQTSEGTVKAQTNAIYRKAAVSGRPQLLSLFIEELMSGPVGDGRAPPSQSPRQGQDVKAGFQRG
ncbi:LuxR C-terminal-related transcriptional regulator [Loktanella sp. SALINAS62]|uniref:helix-turn-helix transcriptional regulator n=1 Tax=Loktanella sp. SALINAS62 TaxID=2706124 RepID=UPI001B8C4F72|nr:LuxR C-terminal-related transcriptional regulator [Loktanella sp. SALINAS62]MBS1303194.1 helix-turn-helix domain-containing protein [Loktanella sp. SALINAS62]